MYTGNHHTTSTDRSFKWWLLSWSFCNKCNIPNSYLENITVFLLNFVFQFINIADHPKMRSLKHPACIWSLQKDILQGGMCSFWSKVLVQ